MLVHGNISQESASKLLTQLQGALSYAPLTPDQYDIPVVVEIPLGVSTIRRWTQNPDDDNSVISSYFQFAQHEVDMRNSLLTEVIEVFMTEPMFNELRTKQQLGYEVSCSFRCTEGYLGYLLTVHMQV